MSPDPGLSYDKWEFEKAKWASSDDREFERSLSGWAI
jgi:hypothetical protein